MDSLELLPYPQHVTTTHSMFLSAVFIIYILYLLIMMNFLRQQRVFILQTSVRH
jgi:hypothetical protein